MRVDLQDVILNLNLECVVQGSGTNNGGGNSASSDQGKGKRRQSCWSRVAGWVQHVDEESYTCYVLFVLIFVLDFSLLTMLFPVTLAAYALATQKPSQRYWQVTFCAFKCSVFFLFCSFSLFCLCLSLLPFACRSNMLIVPRKKKFQMLCCAVLCCAVLCCAVLCCAVLGPLSSTPRAAGVCVL